MQDTRRVVMMCQEAQSKVGHCSTYEYIQSKPARFAVHAHYVDIHIVCFYMRAAHNPVLVWKIMGSTKYPQCSSPTTLSFDVSDSPQDDDLEALSTTRYLHRIKDKQFSAGYAEDVILTCKDREPSFRD